MKAKSFIKENVLGAIALATILGFSSFKLLQPAAVDLVWFERTGPNQYSLMDDGAPSAEPSNGCGTTPAEICAKGFPQNAVPNAEDITDVTLAQDRYHP